MSFPAFLIHETGKSFGITRVRFAYVQDVAYLSDDFLATCNQEASELLMDVVEMDDYTST
jgi:hypothetical protein